MWTPSPQRVTNANLTHFLSRVNKLASSKRRFPMISQAWKSCMHGRSRTKKRFWQHVVQFAGIEFQTPPSRIIEPIDEPPFAEVHGCQLKRRSSNAQTAIWRLGLAEPSALIGWVEEGELGRITFAELTDQVDRVAAFLLSQKIKSGDRVVGYLPNLIETVIACLAALKIGATWSSCSPDFGAKACWNGLVN